MMWQLGGLGMIWMLFFWGGVILLIVDTSNRALEILEERYARGEIDSDEFNRRRSELGRN